MIILSNSIPKSGSTLLANYQEDILRHGAAKSGQDKLKAKFQGRYLATPTMQNLLKLYKIDLFNGSVVVKCHWDYIKKVNLFCLLPNVKMTMTYRDPRDMILSMIDHGNRTRSGQDPSGAFADCFNVIDLIPRTVQLMEQLLMWQSKSYTHCIKYEDMMENPFKVLKEMNKFCNIQLKNESLKTIISSREATKKTSHNFNKGTTNRWEAEMNKEDKQACLKAFEPYLIKLNYKLE